MTLDKRYDEIMEHVEVTPEMRQRILKHIEQTDLTKNASLKAVPFPHIKRLAALAACLAIVLVGTLALPTLVPGPDNAMVPMYSHPETELYRLLLWSNCLKL